LVPFVFLSEEQIARCRSIAALGARMVVAAVLLLLLYAGSATARVNLSWSAPAPVDQPRPYVDPTAIGQVSCPSASLCVALDADGNVLTSTDPAAGAKGWTITRFPSHPYGELQAISCPSVTLCVGVDSIGRIHTTTDPTGGASTWRVVQLRPDAGNLTDVSCPSVSLCVAAPYDGSVLTSTDPTGGAGAWHATPIFPRSRPT
jgi:hypothetical protein